MKAPCLLPEEVAAELDSGECALISDARGSNYAASFCGKRLLVGDWDACLAALNAEMERQQFWPNLFHINDRGNLSLLDSRGHTIESWV